MDKLTEDIFYVGVNDHTIDLFEGMYIVPDGVSYNSYVIIDEKIAVFDSVDAHYGDEWLRNVKNALNGRKPDYLIVQHMEPDHSANVCKFVEEYPDVRLVGNAKTFAMLGAYFGVEFPDKLVVTDGYKLSLGTHELTFLFAPMVHWPEVMVTYESKTKTLFSADAFGKFGALDRDDEWACEARRYYFGIVGKYGAQVAALLKKLGAYPVGRIAPLHGPVLVGGELDRALGLYKTWSAYLPEKEGVFIAYTSVYGHTKEAAAMLKNLLQEAGIDVEAADLAREDWAECVESAFEYSKLVLATTTYNADIYPAMREFIDKLTERNYQNRTLAFVENGTWAPVAAKQMAAKFEKSKNIKIVGPTVKIQSALNEESKAQIAALAQSLINE